MDSLQTLHDHGGPRPVCWVEGHPHPSFIPILCGIFPAHLQWSGFCSFFYWAAQKGKSTHMGEARRERNKEVFTDAVWNSWDASWISSDCNTADISAMPEAWDVSVLLATGPSSWMEGWEIVGCTQHSLVLWTGQNKLRGMTLDLFGDVRIWISAAQGGNRDMGCCYKSFNMW